MEFITVQNICKWENIKFFHNTNESTCNWICLNASQNNKYNKNKQETSLKQESVFLFLIKSIRYKNLRLFV